MNDDMANYLLILEMLQIRIIFSHWNGHQHRIVEIRGLRSYNITFGVNGLFGSREPYKAHPVVSY